MSDLDELKSLLFGAEGKKLESLDNRVSKPDLRADDVSDVLPRALRLSHRKTPDLVAELQDPVTKCVKRSFQQSPQDYVDVLYPVMGPAIRKSIAQALKAFAQQINQTMEYSLSVKGLSWRLQAFKSGIRFSDYIMQQTLQYRVEQAYLISRENGLLIAHVHHQASAIKDGDAVSAMFTAIQDFVKDSFSPESDSRLETADMGEFTLWALHGPLAVIVCVIRGVPPQKLRADLNIILEQIHFRHHENLKTFAGDARTVPGVEQDLEPVLDLQAQQEQERKSSKIWVLLLIILGLLAYQLWNLGQDRWVRHQQIQKLEAAIGQSPGIYLASVDYRKNLYVLNGLRDPLAADLKQLTSETGIPLERIRAEFRPYQSLAPEIVLLRLQQTLAPPQTVSFNLNDDKLSLVGHASLQWLNALKQWQLLSPAPFTLDLSQFKVDGGEVDTSKSTILNLDDSGNGSVNIPTSDSEENSANKTLLTDEALKLSGSEFYFSEGITLIDSDLQRLEIFSKTLKELVNSAASRDQIIKISIVGTTDSSGSLAYNEVLSMQRASFIADTFTEKGLDPAYIDVRAAQENDLSAKYRSARIELELTARQTH